MVEAALSRRPGPAPDMISLHRTRPLSIAALALAACAAVRGAAPAAVPGIQPQALVNHLNKAILWYRQTDSGAGWIGQLSDEVYYDAQHDMAAKVVQDAFASAKACAPLLAGPPAPGGGNANRRESLVKLRGDYAGRVSALQTQIDAIGSSIGLAAPADVPTLSARKSELEAELDLAKVALERLDELDQFAAANADELGAAGFGDQIGVLQRSVLAAFAEEGPKASVRTIVVSNGGLIARAEALVTLVRSIRDIDQLSQDTAQLSAVAEDLSTPLREQIRSIVQQAQTLGAKTGGDASVASLDAARDQLRDMAAQLKGLSSASVPLTEEVVLLREVGENLTQWRDSLIRQDRELLRGFIERATVLVFFLGLGFLASEITRRATFKYVHESRRRRQLLVLRRIGLGAFIGLVLLLGFVSDFSSLATYVGLITAGVAVALQTVILSVFAYFLLIGRYGVRVGDRITVMGVTGEVIETGLVRFYLTELAGTGVEPHPTGRIVVFPNAALFQNNPFYKQLPGTNYTWHEAVVTLAPGTDPRPVQEKLLAVVNRTYADYRPALERQHGLVERLIDLHLEVPKPVAQIRYMPEGLQVVVRFPVELRQADDADSATVMRLAEAIQADPALRAVVTGAPSLQAAVKV
jgi:small-conductance mechanosensitive channel